VAVEYYKKTRELAQKLHDKAVEAQSCYSLGNTYTLLKQYTLAVELHLEHLQFAQQLNDRVGEGRAYWSLGNAFTALGEHTEALRYAQLHLEVSKEVGDRTGELTAEMNIVDLKAVLGITMKVEDQSETLSSEQVQKLFKSERSSHEHVRDTEDVRISINVEKENTPEVVNQELNEDFFDLLYKSQSSRMNDQRCDFPVSRNTYEPCEGSRQASLQNVCTPAATSSTSGAIGGGERKDILVDMIVRMQGDRMDEQRSEFPGLTSTARQRLLEVQRQRSADVPNDAFLDMLMRCQGTRMEDQRCQFPPIPRGPTVPDEDFFNLIVRLQSKRMDTQRVQFQPDNNVP